MTYCQVWWPILEIGPLHLTHPSANTQQWVVNKHTHTWSSGQPLLQCPGSNWGFGVLLEGTSVVVLRVKRALVIHSPTNNSCRTWDSNLQPLDYKSDSLTIRPQLPPHMHIYIYIYIVVFRISKIYLSIYLSIYTHTHTHTHIHTHHTHTTHIYIYIYIVV